MPTLTGRSSLQTSTPVKDRLDRCLRDLRISVTDQCNFRCPYCMPKEKITSASFLKPDEILNVDDITRIARLTLRLGVKKIRLTGGEPLLRSDIFDLITSLSALHGLEDITLTTNGFFLAESAFRLKKSGLHRLTVSLDALDNATFQAMCGGPYPVFRVLEGIRAASQAGFSQIKINVVVRKGINDNTLLDFVDFFRGTGHVVRFIEFMDVGTQNNWHANDVVASIDIYRQIHAHYPLVNLEPNAPGEVAARYAFKDGQGEIGFISSITQPFCQDCSRLRLSPDGKLYSCLFACDGVDVQSLLQTYDEQNVLDCIRDFWAAREDCYSEKRFLNPKIALEDRRHRYSRNKILHSYKGFNPDRHEKISARFSQSALRADFAPKGAYSAIAKSGLKNPNEHTRSKIEMYRIGG